VLSGTPSTRFVPAKAKSSRQALPQALTLTELTTPPPAGFVDASPVYMVEPLALTLETPGEISLPLSNRPGPQAFALYFTPSMDQPFVRMADSYNNAGFIQATLLRGGYYYVCAPASLPPQQCHR
jgi:hypothetical protein